MPRITPFYSPEERIVRMIEIVNDCWVWKGSKRNGYGRLIIGSRTDGTRMSVTAHRYSCSTFVGEIPIGMFVCHICDNPSCVNPGHLFVGTRQDNVNDREAKGRNNHVFGEKNPTSKFTSNEVLEIRKCLESGVGVCRLAKKYNVDHSSISAIRDRKTWKHLPEPPKEKA